MRKRDRSYSRYAGRAPGRGNGSGDRDPVGKLTSRPVVPPHVRRGRCKGGAVVAGINAQPDGSGGLDLAAPWVTIAARAALARGPRPQAFDFSGGVSGRLAAWRSTEADELQDRSATGQ